MKPESIQEMFSRAAERFGGHIAIDRTDKTATYAEVEANSNRLANFLLAEGAGRGSVVAILSDDTFEIINAMIGILKAGCVFVPLSTAMPEARLRAMVAEVSPRWFVADGRFATLLGRITAGGETGAGVIGIDAAEAADAAGQNLHYVGRYETFPDAGRPSISYGPDDMCYLYFTSGSTGRPKAIAGRLKSIAHFVKWEIETFGITEGTRVSQLTSPSFDAFLRDVFVPLCVGGTVCVPEDVQTVRDAGQLIDWIDIQQINLVHCVPSLFRSLLNAELNPHYFSSLKHILMAGERLLPADVKRWMDVFGARVQLVNLYGPSETTMTKLYYPIQPSDQDRQAIPIGKPMAGTRAVVVDAKQRECPPGVVGEIYIRTPFRTLGYYNQPELTDQVFIQNPFSQDPNDIVYKTGDLGRVLEDGNLEFLGRKDLQVKIRGVRIELAEIENLLRGHEVVGDVVVIDREDISGNNYLCAYIVLNDEFETAALKDFLASSQPDYMVPSVFVKMDALPRTFSGKVDRRALPEPVAQSAGAAAPTNPVEEILAGIWAEVLGLPQVGVGDNFFALGGHSLLAALLLSRVRKAFNVELPLRLLFESPTVAQLARGVQAALQGEQGVRTPALQAAAREGNPPLSFAQQGLWFFNQLEPGSTLYNIPGAVRLEGALNYAALRDALREVVRRHEVLRTTFATENSRPVQLIAHAATCDLPLLDLGGLPGEEQWAEARRIMAAESCLPFDLTAGPCWRAGLIKLGEGEHILLLTMHHIISDAWSVEILIRELVQVYGALSAGKESPLPALQIQYADYAIWQRGWLRDKVLEEHLAYWKQQLKGAPPMLELPTDRPRPAEQTYQGKSHHFELPAVLSERLKALSRREGATLFMTLLAAYKVLLNYYTRAEDLVVGAPVATRNGVETEGLIGNFTNTLVLRTDLSADPTFQQLVGRVREAALAAYAHQDLPFGKLVETLRPERNLQASPIAQVSFNLLGSGEDEANSAGLKLSALTPEVETSPYELILMLKGTKQGLRGNFTYNSDLFDATTIAGMAGHFEAILQNVVARPDAALNELRTRLAETDRQQFSRQEKNFKEARFRQLRGGGRRGCDIPRPTADTPGGLNPDTHAASAAS